VPDKKEQEQKKSTQPSPGLLARLFGTEDFTPEEQEGIRIAKQEMPNMAPVQPYGFFSRLVSPNANAYVTGGSNIYLNARGNEGQSPQDIADTLTHEQTHINQKAGSSPFMNFINSVFRGPQEAYHQRPEEMAAYQAEKDRRARMGREQSYVPDFTSGAFFAPRDVILRNEKPKSVLTPRSNNNLPVTMR